MDDRAEHFVRLLSQNERRLTAFVLALVPNWSDADEIVQETKVRLWQQFDEYRDGESFGAWACAIARYQVATYYKSVKRRQSRFSDAFADALAEQIAETVPREAALAECLERLAPKSRDIVRRYYAGDAKVDELAADLSLSHSAIYKALAAARRFLHDCIQRSVEQAGAHG